MDKLTDCGDITKEICHTTASVNAPHLGLHDLRLGQLHITSQLLYCYSQSSQSLAKVPHHLSS